MKRIIIAGLLAAMSVPALAQSAPNLNPNAEVHMTVKELQGLIAAQVAIVEAQKAEAATMQKINAQLAPKHVAAPKPNVAPSKGK